MLPPAAGCRSADDDGTVTGRAGDREADDHEGDAGPAGDAERLAQHDDAEDGCGDGLGERERDDGRRRQAAKPASVQRVGEADGHDAEVDDHHCATAGAEPAHRLHEQQRRGDERPDREQ